MLHNGSAEKIRLNRIDCPEKGQAFGNRAKQFTSTLAFGQTVTVRALNKDRYGRTIGDVILPDGRSLNQELVRAGMAWQYRQYSDDETLAELEETARQGRLGLWADPAPIPPWTFRANKSARAPSKSDGDDTGPAAPPQASSLEQKLDLILQELRALREEHRAQGAPQMP